MLLVLAPSLKQTNNRESEVCAGAGVAFTMLHACVARLRVSVLRTGTEAIQKGSGHGS